jgi:hypothetical protein
MPPLRLRGVCNGSGTQRAGKNPLRRVMLAFAEGGSQRPFQRALAKAHLTIEIVERPDQAKAFARSYVSKTLAASPGPPGALPFSLLCL